MAQVDTTGPPLTIAPDAGRAAARKWPLKWTFLFVVTTGTALWAAILFAV